MNYDTALKIAADHNPELLIDPEVKGQAHICVRARKDGAPFSIHLPETTDDTEADTKVLTNALDAAAKTLGMSK